MTGCAPSGSFYGSFAGNASVRRDTPAQLDSGAAPIVLVRLSVASLRSAEPIESALQGLAADLPAGIEVDCGERAKLIPCVPSFWSQAGVPVIPPATTLGGLHRVEASTDAVEYRADRHDR